MPQQAIAIANLAEAILDRKRVYGFDLDAVLATCFEIELLSL